jgi:hypothetical protein
MMRDELQQGPTVTPLMSAHMTPQVSQAHLDANFWRRITAGIAALNHQNIWIGSEVLVECVEHVLPRACYELDREWVIGWRHGYSTTDSTQTLSQ